MPESRHSLFLLLALLAVGCSFDGSATSRTPPDAGPMFPPEGAPISYWSFDLDASDALGNHPGTLVGTAAITAGAQGFAGDAVALAVEGDRVDIGNPTTFDFNRDFTWHVYFKTATGSGALFSRNPLGTAWNQGSKALFVRANTVQWDTGWVSNPQTGVAVNDDSWHQVIVTYRADGDQLDVFVDAVPADSSGQFSGEHDVNRFDEHSHLHNAGLAETGFSIGQSTISTGLPNLNSLIGLVDEAAVFDRALVGEELAQLIRDGPASFLRSDPF